MDILEIIGSIILLVVGLCTFYWYHLKKCYSYWERLGVPSVPGKNFIGSQGEVFSNVFHEVEVQRYKKYGKIFGHYEGRNPVLTVADPELIKNILVKDFQSFTDRRNIRTGDEISESMVNAASGEKWKRIRTIISPTFSTGKIKKMTSIILDSAETVCENFKEIIKSGKPENVKRLFGAFSMDVIASTAFGTKIDSHNDPDNSFVKAAKLVFGGKVPVRFILFFMFPWVFKFFRMPLFPVAATHFFKDITLKIIEERRRSGTVRNDFLQLLMDANNLTNDSSNVKSQDDREEVEEQPQMKLTNNQKKMSENEILAQCIIFFIAGYETTASTLSSMAYLLALNPEIQERLIKEVDSVVAENKGEITYEGVQSMKYLDSVLWESLRIYSPAVRLERMATEDYELGDTGITIPKGMLVGIPIYAMHHDPELYPDPEKFDPDRFSPDAKAERNPYIYLPFGTGPRNCVGMRFAIMEVKLCMARLLTQFRFKRCPETKVPLDFFKGQGLIMVKEITLAFEERKDS